ncbi:transmembrane emp24 domain-containing protein 10-like [Varanus komodoensis]|uniref:transmembrane emp24 domain-containing protein 10-like n=1 Tax=Varanus komodoensis TaxID=61221 RepID=UPI001CF7C0EE|nr:transmembrane emp24 domain-containing protein 10-like [Varanus komodoensis]
MMGQYQLKVTDSSGHLLYSRDDARKGKRTFITEDPEIYEICFESHGQPGANPAAAAPGSPASPLNSSSPSGLPGTFQTPAALVHFSIKCGVEARNYEDIAKAEKLKPLEGDLRRLRDLSDSIAKAFASVKQWKEESSRRNGSGGACVVFFSIILAFWLVFCLAWFFKAKKLKE